MPPQPPNRCVLLPAALAHDGDGRTGAAGGDVAWGPQHALAVSCADSRPVRAQQAARYALARFHERGRRDLRWVLLIESEMVHRAWISRDEAELSTLCETPECYSREISAHKRAAAEERSSIDAMLADSQEPGEPDATGARARSPRSAQPPWHAGRA